MNFNRQSLAPGLYLVGVPIGTARDITLRALDVLASADVLAAEDTRSLRKLMDIHGIPAEGRRIVPLHDHSGDGASAKLVDHVMSGKSVAYASEAGMPLIADPGFELVRAVVAAGGAVTSAPGPSAVPTALAISTMPTDAFHFAGFLPSAKAGRKKALMSLREIPATLVLFESPKRIAACLRDASEVIGSERPAALCRELTKKFEEVRRGSLAELSRSVEDAPAKGEIVLLIGRNTGTETIDDAEIDEKLAKLLQDMSVKDAAAYLAGETGLKRRDVYQRALALAKRG